jgi:hypothetical protein
MNCSIPYGMGDHLHQTSPSPGKPRYRVRILGASPVRLTVLDCAGAQMNICCVTSDHRSLGFKLLIRRRSTKNTSQALQTLINTQ